MSLPLLVLGLLLPLGTPDPCTDNPDAPGCAVATAAETSAVSKIPYVRESLPSLSAEALYTSAAAATLPPGEERPVTLTPCCGYNNGSVNKPFAGYMSYPDGPYVRFTWYVRRDGGSWVVEEEVIKTDFMDYHTVTCSCYYEEIDVRVFIDDSPGNYGQDEYSFTCPGPAGS